MSTIPALPVPSNLSPQAIAARIKEQHMQEAIPITILKESIIVLGRKELECAVAIDPADPKGKPIRLLSQRKLVEAMGRAKRPSGGESIVQLCLGTLNIKDYVTDSILRCSQPYTWKGASGIARKGYLAELLPELCDLYVIADKAGVLTSQQRHVAEECWHMMRACAKVGIVALVDEATGYQEVRGEHELKLLFDYYFLEQPWSGDTRILFGEEFWKGAFALHGYAYHPSKRPACLMSFISRAIYAYCPRPIYDKVKESNPVIDEQGRRDHLNHEHFTQDAWEKQLQEQVRTVIRAGRRIGWDPSRREEFWDDLGKMSSRKAIDVIDRNWQQAIEDLGIAGLPLFDVETSAAAGVGGEDQ